MTKWQDSPLRPHDQAWPGLNTRGGALDIGRGEMSDCTNVIINREDILEKRKGMIRGIDEQCSGPVCGLFSYTDNCGVEHLLVADNEAISIRTPFAVPVFTAADCYPGDTFSLPDGESLDSSLWRNTTRYTHLSDSMVVVASVTPDDDTEAAVIAGTARWFKDACSASYQVRVRYDFDSANVKQKVAVVLRGSVGLPGALILGVLEFQPGSLYRARLYHRNAALAVNEQLTATLTGDTDGFFTVGYDQVTRTPNMQISVTGGTISETLQGTALTEIEDADLGLTSAIGLSYTGGTPGQGLGIRVVSGGSI